MAPTRGQMLEVELLDAAPAEASPDAPASGHPRRPRARRRGRRAVVAAALLGVLAAYLTGVVGARRDESRAEALASVPGVVAPMTSPVRELWHSRGWLGSDLRQVDGGLVGAVSVPYLTVDVVALDPRTGTDVWRTPVGPAAVNKLWTRCVVPGAPYVDVPPDVRPVVVCVAVDQTTTTEQSALGTMTYPTAVRVVVVDALTGATISDAPAPATSTVAPLGTDVVLARVEP